MKVLIIATPRTGSTTLINVIASILRCFRYHEPYNYVHPSLVSRTPLTVLPENVVVKTMFSQVPKNSPEGIEYSHIFYSQEIKKFDKIIILSRKDILSAYESFNFKVKTDHLGDWHSGYIYKEVDFDIPLFSQFLSWNSNLLEFAYRNNIPVTWHEDLFDSSNETLRKTVESWELGITVSQVQEELKNYRKYRATSNRRTLI